MTTLAVFLAFLAFLAGLGIGFVVGFLIMPVLKAVREEA